MPTPRETIVENAVIEYAEGLGFMHRKISYIGRRGAPDDHFYGSPALFVIVEFKKAGKPPTAQQGREHDRLRGRGFPVHVIDNVEAGKALFDRVLATAKAQVKKLSEQPARETTFYDGYDAH